MDIQVKSSNGISLVPLSTLLLSDRMIFIEKTIDDETACEFVKQVLILNKQDCEKPINVMINTPGGEINAGMLMYDVIQSSRAPVKTFCIGKAHSMGAILFCSGLSGRYMLPSSTLMLHEPHLSNQVGGDSSSIKSISDSLLQTRNNLNQILVKHTGRSVEEIEQATAYDHYFSAEESIDFGLSDAIISFNKLLEV